LLKPFNKVLIIIQKKSKTFEISMGYNINREKFEQEEATMINTFLKSEVGRGITVALISAGITLLTISPLFLMELLNKF
jgi:hypothetical protein